MIQLKNDCLIIKTSDGEQIPCSAEWVTFELMGDDAHLLDPEMVRHASAAVLHYFKTELHRDAVSVSEFAQALERVLRKFGMSVSSDIPAEVSPGAEKKESRTIEFNLDELATNAARESFELVFFPTLRLEMKRRLDLSPNVIRFHNLRECVKKLTGAQRWNLRCQKLHDQIVEFLRSCWFAEPGRRSCALVVV